MRHYVNYALLFFFLVLALTGLLNFFEPFKLATTRIHIVFGFGVVVLVLLHLAERLRYFRKALSPKSSGLSLNRHLLVPAAVSLLLLVACLGNLWPVRQLINLSYEAKNKAIIFRADDHTAFKMLDGSAVLRHMPENTAGIRLQIEWGSAFEPDDGTQIAMWAENSVGMMIKTFFVSQESAFSEELNFEGGKQLRKEVLPVWRHRYTLLSGVDPDGNLDGVSGATPSHSFSIDDYLDAGAQPFYIYVEVNKPGDWQPSVIYGSYIDGGANKAYHLLPLVAHGGDGSGIRGPMYYDLDQITSARDVVEFILVRVLRQTE